MRRGLILVVLASLAFLPAAPSSAWNLRPCKGANITGTAGDDFLVGTSGRDVIRSGPGADTILGLDGSDTMCGGKGRDVLIGGGGTDFGYGAGGFDRCQVEHDRGCPG